MANFGIPYMGSKNGIAVDILNRIPKGKRFVDLFGGGFAISHCAMFLGKWGSVYYNELNPLLEPLIKKAINGEYNYKVFKPEWISRERYFAEKDKDGYIKYIWSFGNNGDNYLFGKDIEPIKRSIHNFVVFGVKDEFINKHCPDIDKYFKTDDIRKRRLIWIQYMRQRGKRGDLQQLERLQRLQRLERLQRLQRLELHTGDYRDYQWQDGDVVYCDPPYEDTAEYINNAGGFNHKEFYDWVYTRDYPVYFSSYNNISDKRFKMIYALGKRTLLSGAKSVNYKYECLYINR